MRILLFILPFTVISLALFGSTHRPEILAGGVLLFVIFIFSPGASKPASKPRKR